MHCPLSFNVDHGPIDCQKDKCAWWIFDRMGTGQCAVKVIAYGVIAHGD